jgi:N-acetylmuramoyl-L-alanine amidase
MSGLWRSNPTRWTPRQWAMAAVVMLAFGVTVFAAGRGLATGTMGEVLRLRFGGDAARTRVVVDLDRTSRGEVVQSGDDGHVVVALAGIAPGQTRTGQGSGLVRNWRIAGAGGASRVELDLSSTAEIERRFLLPPGDGIDHYRYVIDLKATGRAPTPRPDRSVRLPTRRTERPLVVIDPGHGGRDPGAAGTTTHESAVTLAAAQLLKQELERTGRYRVQLTRDTDVYVGLNRRVEIARRAGADLFISLHADAIADPATRGASVYTLSEQGAGRAVREFTRGENWQQNLNLPGRDASVDRILLDMTQRATQNRSARLARTLLGEIEQADHPLLRRSHRDAGLAVLLAPDVPAVLLEMGYMTNPEDERLLTDTRARRRLIRAVAAGIDAYFREADGDVQMAATGGTGQP